MLIRAVINVSMSVWSGTIKLLVTTLQCTFNFSHSGTLTILCMSNFLCTGT